MRAGGSKNTVAVVMAEMGLAARPKRRRKGTTRPGKGRWKAPDLVKRDFPAEQINVKWYGDGTEIVTGEGKLYLDSVLDVGSRRVLGFALGEHHDADLAYGALVMAVAVRGGAVPGVIMHTDRGSEYTASLFRAACERLGISQSMGRPGRLWITRSSNRGTRPWSSSCAGWSTSRPGRPPGPGSRPGSRTTTTTAGIPPSAGSPRSITSGRWRERTPHEGGPAATRPRTRRKRLRRRSPSQGCRVPGRGTRRARVRGRPSGVKAAAHRCAAACGRPDPGDLCGPSGRTYGQAPACPTPGRGASSGPCPARKRTSGNK